MPFQILWAKNTPTFHGESSRKWLRSIALALTYTSTVLRTRHIKGQRRYAWNGFDFEINSFLLFGRRVLMLKSLINFWRLKNVPFRKFVAQKHPHFPRWKFPKVAPFDSARSDLVSNSPPHSAHQGGRELCAKYYWFRNQFFFVDWLRGFNFKIGDQIFYRPKMCLLGILWHKNTPTFHGESSQKWHRSIALALT